MHEMSLLADLMSKLKQIARDEKVEQIVAVTVRLGALAHISAAHFREHFVEAARGTAADGAELIVIESEDTADPHAQDILLDSVRVEE